jgi:hypothetical protein
MPNQFNEICGSLSIPRHNIDKDEENNVTLAYSVVKQNQDIIKTFIFKDTTLFFEGYPYSEELTEKDNWSGVDLEQCRFFEAHEGTLIKVFNISGKWYTSTNRKLCSMKSKWAAKSTTFGLYFADAVKRLVDADIYENDSLAHKTKESLDFLTKIYDKNLNKNFKYMFLLTPHSEERIVCKTKELKFYHIGTLDENNIISYDVPVSFNNCIVDKPKELFFKIKTKNFICDQLKNIDPFQIQGFIAIHTHKQTNHFKFINSQYKYYYSLRNNNPNLKLRYLALRNHKDQISFNKFVDFIHLYNFDEEACNIEAMLKKMTSFFHDRYMNIYILKKQNIFLSETEHFILEQIHNIYIKTKIINTQNRIYEILGTLNVLKINRAMKEWNH